MCLAVADASPPCWAGVWERVSPKYNQITAVLIYVKLSLPISTFTLWWSVGFFSPRQVCCDKSEIASLCESVWEGVFFNNLPVYHMVTISVCWNECVSVYVFEGEFGCVCRLMCVCPCLRKNVFVSGRLLMCVCVFEEECVCVCVPALLWPLNIASHVWSYSSLPSDHLSCAPLANQSHLIWAERKR